MATALVVLTAVALGADGPPLNQIYETAKALAEAGKIGESIDAYHSVLARDWDYVPALDDLAWIRATSVDARFRDGREAEKLATHLVEITQYRYRAVTGGEYPRAYKIHSSHTLAAAYAANGNFPMAVGYAIQSLETAQRMNDISPSEMAAGLVGDAETYLKVYRSGVPFTAAPGYRRTPVPLHQVRAISEKNPR